MCFKSTGPDSITFDPLPSSESLTSGPTGSKQWKKKEKKRKTTALDHHTSSSSLYIKSSLLY